MGADLGVVDEKVAEAWDKSLAEMKRELWADMKAALPRSEMGRALMAELAAEEARERAARACHNCVFLDSGIGVQKEYRAWCLRSHWECEDPTPRELRRCLRTASSCDDYEEVDDGQEGVEG